MSSIKCPVCGDEVSATARICPCCGSSLRNSQSSQSQSSSHDSYETQTITISYWTKNGLDEKLSPYLKNGWEVMTMKENRWRSGALRHVYDVVLRRPKK